MEVGNIIDKRYKLLRKLGSGGFSEVWLAEKIQVNQINVALKIYYPDSTTSEELRKFVRKFEMVYNLHHTNLLSYSDCNEDNGMLYFVMPWCERGSVASQAGRMSETEAWRFLADVSSGLACLHHKNIIHQDIKPDNVLISDDNSYLITDFDISVKSKNTRRMGDETPAGTAAYMAPERFGRHASPIQASDVWALGASLYELLTGKFPFGDNGGLYQKSGIPIPTVNRHISHYLQSIITLCLQPAPWDRPTAKEISDICEEYFKNGRIAFEPKFRKILGISNSTLLDAIRKLRKPALIIAIIAAVATGAYYGVSAIVKHIQEQEEIEEQRKIEAERQRELEKQKKINNLLSNANAAFDGTPPDYEKAFQSFMEAKNLGSSDTTGYAKFLNKAQTLFNILGQCDATVCDLLLKAQQLNDTAEIRNEIIRMCHVNECTK
jgi:serine/threonine protein kinase